MTKDKDYIIERLREEIDDIKSFCESKESESMSKDECLDRIFSIIERVQ